MSRMERERFAAYWPPEVTAARRAEWAALVGADAILAARPDSLRVSPRAGGGSIRIENAGQRILSTTYWSTYRAARGLVYVSVNAGAVRILLPPPLREEVAAAARLVSSAILSKGPWHEQPMNEVFELLFDDRSDNPYSLVVSAGQCDRKWGADDDGQTVPLTLWGPGKELGGVEELISMPCHLRSVPKIPWMQPWID